VLVKVDLTIESFYSAEDSSTSNHLGIMATNSMKEWMRQYPALHNVSIILKDLLKRRDLNNIYKGTFGALT
jgi:DNA polymerase sigma